jgi:hypothetical protein
MNNRMYVCAFELWAQTPGGKFVPGPFQHANTERKSLLMVTMECCRAEEKLGSCVPNFRNIQL